MYKSQFKEMARPDRPRRDMEVGDSWSNLS